MHMFPYKITGSHKVKRLPMEGMQNPAFQGKEYIPRSTPLEKGRGWTHAEPTPGEEGGGLPTWSTPTESVQEQDETRPQEALGTVAGRVEASENAKRDRGKPWPIGQQNAGPTEIWEGRCPPLTWISVRNIVALTGCLLESVVLTGSLFGWHSMVYVLQVSILRTGHGSMRDLCLVQLVCDNTVNIENY